MKFEKYNSELNRISSIYQIKEEHAGCYMVNYEDQYICHEYNGGCKSIEKCREIREKESC